MMLTEEIIQRLKKDHKARRRISDAAGEVSDDTVKRWLRRKDIRLVSFDVVVAICNYYKVDGTEILEPKTAEK